MSHSIPPRLLLSLALLSTVMASAPVSVPWSSDTYGPEGPWHAVSVNIGTPAQRVDLFPAISYSPNILSRAWCLQANLDNVNCSTSPRFFYANGSSTSDWTWYTRYGAPNSWVSPLWNNGNWNLLTDFMSVPVKGGDALRSNVSLQLVTSGEIKTGPNLDYSEPYSLGTLGLGAPENYIHPLSDGQNQSLPIGNLTANYFANDQSRLPSASFGLHYGSVAAKIPPSFSYGGYDRARIIGDPISLQFQNGINSQIALGDISIGTAEGASPWSYPNKTKSGLLLLNSTTSATPTQQLIQVSINPGTPYMMLPEATCDAIAAQLPVTYNPDRQIYFWNTATPNYTRIVNGANYLAFTFTQLTGPDVTIKIPFQLLNLTQTGPSGTQAAYFPCFRHGQPNYVLGRAFAQGAFFGGNWFAHAIGATNTQPGSWFLAQGPGPGVGNEDLQPLAQTQRTVQTSSRTWESTWEGHWTPRDEQGVPLSNSTTTSAPTSSATGASSGLSPGAQAGIAVPIVLLGLALLGFLLWFFVLRPRRQAAAAAAAQRADSERGSGAHTIYEKHGEPAARWELLEREDKPAQLDGEARVPAAEMEAPPGREKRAKGLDKPLPAIRHEMPA